MLNQTDAESGTEYWSVKSEVPMVLLLSVWCAGDSPMTRRLAPSLTLSERKANPFETWSFPAPIGRARILWRISSGVELQHATEMRWRC